MKVIFLMSHLLSGGAERTVSYLSGYFANNGIDTEICSISDDVFYDLDSKVRLTTLHIPGWNGKNHLGRLVLMTKRFFKVNSHLKKNDYDAVICILPDTAKYVLAAHRKNKFKLITSERNNPEICNGRELRKKKKMYECSDGIIFQTQRAMEFYSEEIQKKGIVIHNAIGNEYAYTCPKVEERKKKITAIGRLTEQKDYPVLLEAFSGVLKKHPEYSLEIFGKGPNQAELETLAAEMGISDNVCFMGVHKDAIIQAANSACYVMSSKYEGMPNALMEAMAVGLPCISTDCPNGPAELIENGKNGILVPVGDAQALGSAILKMIEDRDFAERCGENAREILKTHSIEIKAKEYMDYIMKICNEGKR